MPESSQFNPEVAATHLSPKELTAIEQERNPGKPHGVYLVVEVVPGSPAEQADLEVGDEILSVDGKPTTTFAGWFDHAQQKADQPIVLKVRHDGVEADLILVQEYLPTENRYRAGFTFQPELRSEERLETVDLGGYVVLRHHGKMYDAERKEACTYQYDLGKGTIQRAGLHKENKPELARRLRSFILRAPGKEKREIELLDRFNSKNVPVYVSQGSGSQNAGVHHPYANEVVLQRIAGNFCDVHVLLHELRHAHQDENPRISKIKDFYGAENLGRNEGEGLAQWDPDSLIKKLKAISKLAGLNGLEGKLDDDKLGKKLWDIVQEGQDKGDFEKEIPTVLAVEVAAGLTIKDILMLPRRIMERDAEFGALSAERRIRQETGIDLFGLYYDYRKENNRQNVAFAILEQIRSATDISDEERAKTENEFKEELKELEKEGVKSTVVQSVRKYMSSIGATPGIIRKYLEAGEKRDA